MMIYNICETIRQCWSLLSFFFFFFFLFFVFVCLFVCCCVFFFALVLIPENKNQARPRGYKTFFMLNSTENELLNDYKYKNIEKIRFF